MNFIITGGKMSTKVDSVREITNTSTGTLAIKFIKNIDYTSNDITLIKTKDFNYDNKNINIIDVKNPDELLCVLKENVKENTIVIHLMAVSDFTVHSYIDLTTLTKKILLNKHKINTKEDAKKLFNNNYEEKLSSSDDQLLYLKRTVKVIDHIKKINDKCFLVSFKLTVNKFKDSMQEIGIKQMLRTNSDIVVVNDINNIKDNKHLATILANTDVYNAKDKDEIATTVLKLIKEKHNG